MAKSSSVISGIRYDAETKTAEIDFRNGSHYRYAGVDRDTLTRVVNAESVGHEFNRSIRDRFPTTKVR